MSNTIFQCLLFGCFAVLLFFSAFNIGLHSLYLYTIDEDQIQECCSTIFCNRLVGKKGLAKRG